MFSKKKLLAILLCTLLFVQTFVFAVSAAGASDNSVTYDEKMEEKINETLAGFTLRRRSYFANGATDISQSGNTYNGNQTVQFKDYGISYLAMSDGPYGINQGARAHTGFGSGLIISSTWNRDLVERVGDVIGKESLAKDVQYFLGPATNINRDLIGGRVFEYYSEDPFLSAETVVPYVKGVQKNDVAVTIKHIMANNQEWNRNFCSSNIAERAMHEVYLVPFEQSVKEGDAWGFMTAANRMNGVFTSDNRYILTNMLKHDYAFKGIVMTDWCNTRTGVIAAKAGLDIAMPGNSGSLFSPARMEEYVRSGQLDESVLDQIAQRCTRVAFLTKSALSTDTLDNSGYTPADRNAGEINTASNQQVALEVAEEGIILLKNENDILPLNKEELSSVALIGKYVNYQFYGNHGGSGVNFPPFQTTYLKGIQDALNGYDVNISTPAYDEGNLEKTIADAVESAKNSQYAIIFAGINSTSTSDPNVADTEDGDRQNLDFPTAQLQLINAVAEVQPNTIVVTNGSVFEVRDWVDNVPAMIHTFYAGMQYGKATAEILFGDVNPSGKLPHTWPKRYEETCGYVDNGDNSADQKSLKVNDVWYDEGVFVGYKWYDKLGIEPEFPFGYGLSYTNFEYSNIRINKDSMTPDEKVTVFVDVTNTGSRDGKETVQMYINDPEAKVVRPYKELKGYEKVELKAGETKTVSFDITVDLLSYWDVDYHSYMADAGLFNVMIGSSSDSLPLTASFTLTESTQPDEDYTVYQAEAAELSDTQTLEMDELDSEMMESAKIGYVKMNTAGSSVKWTVNVDEAGEYSLIVHYSNGSYNGAAASSYGKNMVSPLYVNGELQGSYDFQNTRYENVWNFDSIDVELKAGRNEIVVEAGSDAAGLNIDKLIVQKMHQYFPEVVEAADDSLDVDPPVETEDGQVYQAENYKNISGGSSESKYPGYTGDGYITLNGASSEATWDVLSVTFAYGFRLGVTYSNGKSTAAEADLYVNGVKAGTYYLAPTGSYAKWSTEISPKVTLRTGINTIRLVSKTQGVYIDKLVVSGGMTDFETKAPVMNGSVPMSGKSLGSISDPVVAGFSEVVVGADNFSDIHITDEIGNIISSNAVIDGTKVMISANEALAYGETYNAVIPVGAVKDENGNVQAEEYTISFKTPQINCVENDDGYLTFAGSWTATENELFSGGTSNYGSGTVTYWFNGINSVIYGTKGPDMGTMTVKIDDEHTYTADMRSDSVSYGQLLFSTGTMDSGIHKVQVTISGSAEIDYVGAVGNVITGPFDQSSWDARSFATSSGAYGQPEGPKAAINGQHGNRWVSCQMQSGNEWFIVDLGKETTFNALVLDTPNADYTRAYEIYVANNVVFPEDTSAEPTEADWSECVASGIGNQYFTTVMIGDTQTARYIKIRQTGSAGGNWWCMHEIYAFNITAEDNEPPTAPGYVFTTGENSQITLDWEPSTDDVAVAGYNVYRDGVLIGRTQETSYVDAKAENLVVYEYAVQAYDRTGKVSELSEPVKAITDPTLSNIDRSTWTASAFLAPPSSDYPYMACDGNLSTRWTSYTAQTAAGDQWFQIDFGKTTTFNRLEVDANNSGDHMRGYKVVVSDDGENWSEPVAEGDGENYTVIQLDEPATCRYVRIYQTKGLESGAISWWSIYEVYAYINTPASRIETPETVNRNEKFDFVIKTLGGVELPAIFNESGKKITSKVVGRTEDEFGIVTWNMQMAIGTPGEARSLTVVDSATGESIGEFTIEVVKPTVPDGIVSITNPEEALAGQNFQCSVVATKPLIKSRFENESGNKIGAKTVSRVIDGDYATSVYDIVIETRGERTITFKADYDKRSDWPFEKQFGVTLA